MSEHAQKSKPSRSRLRLELTVFFLALGVLIGVGAYFTYVGLQSNDIPLWGYPRHLAIGVPLAVIAGLHLLSGLLVAIIPNPLASILGGLSTTLLPIFYYALMLSTLGRAPINLIALLLIATPILVWSRVGAYFAAE